MEEHTDGITQSATRQLRHIGQSLQPWTNLAFIIRRIVWRKARTVSGRKRLCHLGPALTTKTLCRPQKR